MAKLDFQFGSYDKDNPERKLWRAKIGSDTAYATNQLVAAIEIVERQHSEIQQLKKEVAEWEEWGNGD